jgi:hypothetical protein
MFNGPDLVSRLRLQAEASTLTLTLLNLASLFRRLLHVSSSQCRLRAGTSAAHVASSKLVLKWCPAILSKCQMLKIFKFHTHIFLNHFNKL